MSLFTKLLLSELRPPESAAVAAASTGRLHRPVAEQKMKTDPQPCSSTESREELRACNKALRLNHHCAPGLHLIVCMYVYLYLYMLMNGKENKH